MFLAVQAGRLNFVYFFGNSSLALRQYYKGAIQQYSHGGFFCRSRMT